MNLRGRLTALDRLAREGGYLTGEPRCPACGGPGSSPLSMILLDEGEELRSCFECKHPTHENGQPCGRVVVVMELHDAPVGHRP